MASKPARPAGPPAWRLALLVVAGVLVGVGCGGGPRVTPTAGPSTSSPSTGGPPAPAASIEPATFAALLAEGRTQLQSGQIDAAQRTLERAVAANPQSHEAHFLLGNAYYSGGQLDPARAQFQAALALKPDYGAAHLNLGVVYYSQSGPASGPLLDQAIGEFEQAIALEPSVADNHYMLGVAQVVQATGAGGTVSDPARMAQAKATFEKVIGLDNAHAPAHVGLGNVYLLQNDAAAAVPVLERATQLNPQLPEAWFALGKAYQANGAAAQAVTAYQAFLNLNPPNAGPQVAEAQQAIADLQGK